MLEAYPSKHAAPRDQPVDDEPSARRLRMKDLCEATGLDRQAIHFYIQQGLLAPGEKTGRNMAWYTEAHVERLLLIKKLQHERFLPLKAIKALLDGRDESFPPEQRAFLASLKPRLDGAFALNASDASVDADTLVARAGLDAHDLDEAIDLGLVSTHERDGARVVPAIDAWMLELLGQMRSIGFTRELGFTVADVAFYEEAMSKLFREEMRLLARRLSALPADEVAEMISRALPVIHDFLVRAHTSRVAAFFQSVED